MAIFTNTKGERVQTKKDEQGNVTRNVLATGVKSGEPIPTTEAISSTTLTPEPSISIPDTPPATAVQGELAKFEGATNSFTENLNKQAEEQSQKEATSFEALMKQFSDTPTETAIMAQEYAKKGGVDEIQRELTDINDQIRQEQLSLRRRTEAIEARGGGLQSGANAEIQNIRRESLKTQADLSVIQMGIQGRYNDAKAIADRAVTARKEEGQRQIDALQLVYDRNKSLFDKSEQRAFESAQADRQRKLDAETEMQKTINNLAISAMEKGAPTSVTQGILSSKNLSEAMKASGGFFAPKTEAEKWEVKSVNGVDMLFNPRTAEFKPISAQVTVTSQPIVAKAESDIQGLTTMLSGDGLKSAVGPNPFARVSALEGFTGQRGDFIAGIQTLVANLTLDSLIQAKAEGATFGALTEREWDALQSAGTKINEWAIRGAKGTPDEGKIIGYKTTEKSFRQELDKINNFAKIDALLKGADPEKIGVKVLEDGTYATTDSFGNIVILE